MTAGANPMSRLRLRLSGLGVSKKYLDKKVLPDWWDDAIAEEPTGFSEALLYVSRHLGIEIASLRSEKLDLRFQPHGVTKYKKASGVNVHDCRLSEAIAVRAAVAVAAGSDTPFSALEDCPHETRQAILQLAATANLESLLNHCWAHGVPVIHIGEFPGKKIDGLCVKVGGRPVIVVSKNSKFSAWLVFIVAHEMGHVFHNHLTEDGVIFDEKWGRFDDLDGEEQLANAYASEVLNGNSNPNFGTAHRITGPTLAEKALRFGPAHHIDPGVIALNHGWIMKSFGVANAALNYIEPDGDPAALIHAKMIEHLNLEQLSEESHAWLLRVTGAGLHA